MHIKHFVGLLLTILLLIFTQPVSADLVAGNSANMYYTESDGASFTNDQTYFIKKRAIKNYLSKFQTPLIDHVDAFIQACQLYNLDCYLLPSIAGLESTFGKFIWPNSYNAFGWARGFMMFDSWEQGIDTVGKGLRKGYLNKGALTVEDIGPIYSESPTWAVRVNFFINQFEKEEKKMSLLSGQLPVEL